MSLSQPSPPNPATTAAAQEQINLQSAEEQQQVNDVNQVTPYGDLTYTQTGTGANGIPIMTGETTLSPAEQGLLTSTLGTQQQIASDAGTLASNLGTSLTNPPNLSNADLTNTMLGWQQQYMQPIFNQQQSNLNSQLAAQGITQGSDAYNNAENLFSRNENNAYENAMASDVGQAYQQALGSYEAPIQTLGTLLGEGSPASVSSNLVQTPEAQVQPANEEAIAEANYQQQMQQYSNTISGLFSIPSALLGGWARTGFTTSDQRRKKNIVRIGWLNDGTPIYRFRIDDDPRMQIGLIAQDIAKIIPEAICLDGDGFMMVDYERATENAARASA